VTSRDQSELALTVLKHRNFGEFLPGSGASTKNISHLPGLGLLLFGCRSAAIRWSILQPRRVESRALCGRLLMQMAALRETVRRVHEERLSLGHAHRSPRVMSLRRCRPSFVCGGRRRVLASIYT